MKVVSQVVRDWQLGWVLRYQSGDLIQTPGSTNQLITQLLRPAAGFGPGSTNLQNYVPGQAQLLVDPNSKSFDPAAQQLLNPKAWSDPATGQWGVSSPFYNGYRWQRQPSEAMSFARNFWSVCALMVFCSGASTSLMSALYVALTELSPCAIDIPGFKRPNR